MKIAAFSVSGPSGTNAYEAGFIVDGRTFVLFDSRSLTGSLDDLVSKVETGMAALVDATAAADEAPIWAAEFLSMADIYDHAKHEAGIEYTSGLSAMLRQEADNPPDCEEAFRFRLCLILDWHPNRDKADLDAAVSRARSRKVP